MVDVKGEEGKGRGKGRGNGKRERIKNTHFISSMGGLIIWIIYGMRHLKNAIAVRTTSVIFGTKLADSNVLIDESRIYLYEIYLPSCFLFKPNGFLCWMLLGGA